MADGNETETDEEMRSRKPLRRHGRKKAKPNLKASILDDVPLNHLSLFIKRAKANTTAGKKCGVAGGKSLTKMHNACRKKYGNSAFFSQGTCDKYGRVNTPTCKEVYTLKPYKRKGKQYPGGVKVRTIKGSKDVAGAAWATKYFKIF
jgi:hypothetical protein